MALRAASVAFEIPDEPLKRLSPAVHPNTGLKPGANENADFIAKDILKIRLAKMTQRSSLVSVSPRRFGHGFGRGRGRRCGGLAR